MRLCGDRNLVKLDFDGLGSRPSLSTLVRKLYRAGYHIRWLWERPSPSGKGWHMTLKLSPVPKSPQEVIALQAILGSDLWREAHALRKANHYDRVPGWMRDRWNVLYYPYIGGASNGAEDSRD